MNDIVGRLFSFEKFGELLEVPFVQTALIACAVLGLVAGVLAPLIVYRGRASNKFGLLTGSIVAVDTTNLAVLGVVSVIVIGVLAVLYRPLLFASTDPDVAIARGVPVRMLSLVFAVLIGLTTALVVPI